MAIFIEDLYLRATTDKDPGTDTEDLSLRSTADKEAVAGGLLISLSASITASSQTSSAILSSSLLISLLTSITASSQTSTAILTTKKSLSGSITASSQTSNAILNTSGKTSLAASITVPSQTSSAILVTKKTLSTSVTAASQTSTAILTNKKFLLATIAASSQMSLAILIARKALAASISISSEVSLAILAANKALSASITILSQTSSAILTASVEFPSQTIIETFTGDDDTSPPNANWNGDLEIQSNQAAGTGPSDNFGYWNVRTFGPNSEVYATITTKPIADEYIEFLLRFDFAAGNGYALRITTLAGTDKAEIMKYSSWVPVQLNDDIEQEISVGDAIGLEMIGDTLQAYRKPSGDIWNFLGASCIDTGTMLIWDLTEQIGNSSWNNASPGASRLFRGWVKNASITANATRIKLVIKGHSSSDTTIDGIAIGPKKTSSDVYDYADAGEIANVQVGGEDSFIIPAGTTVESDELDFTIDKDTDYLISTYFDGGGNIAYLNAGSGIQQFKVEGRSVDETETRDVSGYTSGDQYCGPTYQIISIL